LVMMRSLVIQKLNGVHELMPSSYTIKLMLLLHARNLINFKSDLNDSILPYDVS